jgi:hypothetical protein
MFYILAAILIIIFGAVILKLKRRSEEKKRLARERLLRGEALKPEVRSEQDDWKQYPRASKLETVKKLSGDTSVWVLSGLSVLCTLLLLFCIILDIWDPLFDAGVIYPVFIPLAVLFYYGTFATSRKVLREIDRWQETLKEAVLIAKPKNEYIHTIFDGDIPITELEYNKCVIGDSTYVFSSHGFPYKGYDVKENGRRVAFADQSVFKEVRGIVIQHGGLRYRLEYGSDRCILLRGDKEIGSLSTEAKSFPSDEKTIDLPETMSLFLRVFIFWIVLKFWKPSGPV